MSNISCYNFIEVIEPFPWQPNIITRWDNKDFAFNHWNTPLAILNFRTFILSINHPTIHPFNQSSNNSSIQSIIQQFIHPINHPTIHPSNQSSNNSSFHPRWKYETSTQNQGKMQNKCCTSLILSIERIFESEAFIEFWRKCFELRDIVIGTEDD